MIQPELLTAIYTTADAVVHNYDIKSSHVLYQTFMHEGNNEMKVHCPSTTRSTDAMKMCNDEDEDINRVS